MRDFRRESLSHDPVHGYIGFTSGRDLPAGDSREFAQVALRHGALILPGPAMSAAEQHSSFIRLPFLASDETLRAGVRRLSARATPTASSPAG